MNDLVIEAAAGSGKTSTLELLAKYKPDRRGLYLAFNKSIADDARRRFAGTGVNSLTMHSLALRATPDAFRERLSGAPRFTPWGVIAQRVGIDEDYVFAGDEQTSVRRVRRESLTRAAQDTAARFMRSADFELSRKHVQLPKSLVVSGEAAKDRLADTILEFASTIWADFANPDGVLPYKHDAYLKLYQLSKPQLGVSFVALDEAQDADELMLDIIRSQEGVQRILVGDRAQAIYSWRGAVNSMDSFPEANRARLTRSWRFGQTIADEAQKWLDLLGSDMRILGSPGVSSAVAPSIGYRDTEAVVCRTNGGAIGEVFDALEEGRRVGVAGERKAEELQKLAKAAVELQEKGKTRHADFQVFSSWDEVVELSETEDGKEFAPLVKVIDRFGGKRVVAALDRCSVQGADLIVSTAHIAKGLEWGSVRIADDFPEPRMNKELQRKELKAEEARLAYVTVTRAKRLLGLGGLDWINTAEGAGVELV